MFPITPFLRTVAWSSDIAGLPETVLSWESLLLDDVLDGGPRPPAATPTNRGDGSEEWRTGTFD